MGPRDSDVPSMLAVIDGGKYKTLDALVDATVPDAIKLSKPMALADAERSESEALSKLRSMANKVCKHPCLFFLPYM
jgi:glycine cleavage system pyridoxal-binding protein P